MAYKRPTSDRKLSKPEKVALLKEYYEHCRVAAQGNAAVFNVKMPRGAAAEILDRIGEMLVREAEVSARADGPVAAFLSANPVPPPLRGLLPHSFRAFCLILNALKQWIAAEQLATDRYLLGGTSRTSCREAATTCLVTGEVLKGGGEVELHHPVRDGRPPIPVSKRGHKMIEKQTSVVAGDPVHERLLDIKRAATQSWKNLRRACRDLMGEPVAWSSRAVMASSKSFAGNCSKATGMSFVQLLAWLDEKGLGLK